MKMILGSTLIFGAIYFGIYFLDTIGILDIPQKRYSATANKIAERPKDIKETVFKNAVEVEWNGKIFGVLQSGNGYAIKKLDEKSKYPQFMAFWPGDKIEWLDGSVKIKGVMEGIDCAYQNTVFGGKCVPFVTIKSAEIIKEKE